MFESNKEHKSAYSFIELLVIVALIGVVLLIGSVKIKDFLERQKLIESARTLEANLLSARQKALSSFRPASCLGELSGYQVEAKNPNIYEISAICGGSAVLINYFTLSDSDKISWQDITPILLLQSLADGCDDAIPEYVYTIQHDNISGFKPSVKVFCPTANIAMFQ